MTKNLKSKNETTETTETCDFLLKENFTNKESLPAHTIINSLSNNYIQDMMKDVLYNSLAQACMKIYQTKNLTIKLFLYTSILFLNCLASFLVIQSIRDYFDYQVITTTRTIYETPTLFPKVTICNLNMLQNEYGWDFISRINSSWNFLKYPSLMKNLSYTEKYTLKTKFYALAQYMILQEHFTEENLKRFGHSLKDLLIKCYFKNYPCSYTDFVWTFDPFYGNCYVFNANENHKISIPGWDNGLKLELYVNFYEKLNRINSVYGGVGALIRIENSSYFVDHGWEGIKVPGGFQSDIAVDRKFKEIMPKPYSNCEINEETRTTQFNSDLFEIIKQSRYAYSQKLCFGQCYQKRVIEECNCTDSSFLSLFTNHKSAKTQEQIDCAFSVYNQKFLSGSIINDYCIPLCPLECNRTELKVSISSLKLLGDDVANYIRNNKRLLADFTRTPIDSVSASSSIVKVNIFYDSMSYELSTESPKMNIVSMLATIGGNLSLFLGVSVFSLCELVEVAIEIYIFKRAKNTNQNA